MLAQAYFGFYWFYFALFTLFWFLLVFIGSELVFVLRVFGF